MRPAGQLVGNVCWPGSASAVEPSNFVNNENVEPSVAGSHYTRCGAAVARAALFYRRHAASPCLPTYLQVCGGAGTQRHGVPCRPAGHLRLECTAGWYVRACVRAWECVAGWCVHAAAPAFTPFVPLLPTPPALSPCRRRPHSCCRQATSGGQSSSLSAPAHSAASVPNVPVAGHKRWALFPPGAPKELLKPPGVEREAASWFACVYPRTQQPGWPAEWKPVDVVQEPGET